MLKFVGLTACVERDRFLGIRIRFVTAIAFQQYVVWKTGVMMAFFFIIQSCGHNSCFFYQPEYFCEHFHASTGRNESWDHLFLCACEHVPSALTFILLSAVGQSLRCLSNVCFSENVQGSSNYRHGNKVWVKSFRKQNHAPLKKKKLMWFYATFQCFLHRNKHA